MVIDVLERDDLPFPGSLPEFQRLFPDEAACAAYLERARWGNGFACPYCGTSGEPYRYSTRPGVLCCRACRHETRLTAGTVMLMPSFTLPNPGPLHLVSICDNRISTHETNKKMFLCALRASVAKNLSLEEPSQQGLEPLSSQA
jgi:hypothetical protein